MPQEFIFRSLTSGQLVTRLQRISSKVSVPEVYSIQIASCNFGNQSKQIGELLANFTNLRNLSIKVSHIINPHYIGRSISKLPNLTKLKLHIDNAKTADGLLSSIGLNLNITQLILHNFLTASCQDIIAVYKAISKNLVGLTLLHSFQTIQNKKQNLSEIFDEIIKLENLNILNLDKSLVLQNFVKLHSIFSSLTKLYSLDINFSQHDLLPKNILEIHYNDNRILENLIELIQTHPLLTYEPISSLIMNSNLNNGKYKNQLLESNTSIEVKAQNFVDQMILKVPALLKLIDTKDSVHEYLHIIHFLFSILTSPYHDDSRFVRKIIEKTKYDQGLLREKIKEQLNLCYPYYQEGAEEVHSNNEDFVEVSGNDIATFDFPN